MSLLRLLPFPRNRHFQSIISIGCSNLVSHFSTKTIKLSNVTNSSEWKPILPLSQRLLSLPSIYSSLSKLRLSALVVTTTAAGYYIFPSYSSLSPSFSTFMWTIAGVSLCSFSANTFNQWLEVPFDSQMGRTRMRPLPTMQLSSLHAFTFGVSSGLFGVGLLASQVSWLAAYLAGLNIALYVLAYTPSKRFSIVNTWIGAVVGAIPPMIGYVAANGGVLSGGSLVLGGILYCWQFPHFNSLSWNLKHEYARAGYCMASVLNPKLNVNVALLHSIALIPLSGFLCLMKITNWPFLYTSSIANMALIYLSWKFKRRPERKSARTLFLSSLLHLPILLSLILVHKKRKEDLESPSTETVLI